MNTQANQTCSNCKHFGTLPRSAADSRHQCRHPAQLREPNKVWKLPTESCLAWQELPVSPPAAPSSHHVCHTAEGLEHALSYYPPETELAKTIYVSEDDGKIKVQPAEAVTEQLAAAQQEANKLAQLLDKVHTNLKGLTTAIKREEGRCLLAGHATHVALIEDSLQLINDYIEGDSNEYSKD